MFSVGIRIKTTINLIATLIALVGFTGCKEKTVEKNDICSDKYSGEWDFHYYSDNSKIGPLTIYWGVSSDYSGSIKTIPSTCQISVPNYGSGSLVLNVQSDGQILNTCGNNSPPHWSISCSGYFEGDSILHYTTYEQSPPNQVHIYSTFLLGIKKGSNIKGKAPTSLTLHALKVTSSSATLNATINPNLLPTSASFQYGTMTGSYFSNPSVPGVISNEGENSVYYSLNNLTPGTTYYFRSRASNAFGTTYGNELSFTTPP